MAGVGRMELEETAADAVKEEEEEAKNKSDFQKKNMRCIFGEELLSFLRGQKKETQEEKEQQDN